MKQQNMCDKIVQKKLESFTLLRLWESQWVYPSQSQFWFCWFWFCFC
jgi:hypothetical protein